MKRFFVCGARRRYVLMLAAAAIVATAGITVISRQKAAERAAENLPTTNQPDMAATRSRPYVTRRVAGQNIQVDTQTGQTRPLTAQEAQNLAEELAPLVDKSTDDLPKVRRADGSISMDLRGRAQSVIVARVNADGTMEQSCVDNPESAGKFFGVDPGLIRNAQAARKTVAPSVSPNHK